MCQIWRLLIYTIDLQINFDLNFQTWLKEIDIWKHGVKLRSFVYRMIYQKYN